MKTRLYLFVTALHAACTPVPAPVTPPPDASDAAAVGDAPPPAPQGPVSAACALACSALLAVPCAEAPTCGATLTRTVDGEHRFAEPGGAPLTCADLSKVKTRADVTALGQTCAPPGVSP